MINQIKSFLTIFIIGFLLFIPMEINAEVTNKYCPVTTSELAEEKFSLEYEGDTIYFCCNNCIKDFLNNPEAYLDNLEKINNTKTNSDDNHKNTINNSTDSVLLVNSISPGEHQENIESVDHDHTEDHGESNSFTTIVGKFHPLVVHFPIALIVTAMFFVIISIFLKGSIYDTIAVYLIYLSALSGIVTVLFGLAAGAGSSYPSFLVESFEWHQAIGITTGILTLFSAAIGYLFQQRKISILYFRIILFVNTIFVGITGHFGAKLVYGPDYFNFLL